MDRKSTPAGPHTNSATYLLNSYCVAVDPRHPFPITHFSITPATLIAVCIIYLLFIGFCDQNLFMVLDMNDYLPGNHIRIAPHIVFNYEEVGWQPCARHCDPG
jgi:hypothetical protein